MKFHFHRKNLVSVSIIFFYPSTFTFHKTVINSMIYSEIDFQKCKNIYVCGMRKHDVHELGCAPQRNSTAPQANDIVLSFNRNAFFY